MVLAGIDSGWYKTVLVLHILCAIVGFGAVVLNALYGAEVRKRPGPEGIAVFDANYRVSMVGEWFIYGVFVFGFLLVLLSDDVWEFDQTWVLVSIVLYAIGIGLSHGVMAPTLRRMRPLMVELAAAPAPGGAGGAQDGGPDAAPAGPPPQVAELERLGKRLAAVGPVLNVILVVILALMVWKPGL